MSAIHIASAANEVAQALPSTATVSVSRHGIQAIETLNLEAQNTSKSQLTWSRTFSGMEILTNPTVHYRTVTDVELSTTQAQHVCRNKAAFDEWLEHIRPTSDPLANASSNLNVTVNNASMSITPKVDHRIVTSFYPEEREVAHQRKHYGLNQLDQYAESSARTFQKYTIDDVERQHNTNALRDNYPCRVYASTNGTTYDHIDKANLQTIIAIELTGAVVQNDILTFTIKDFNNTLITTMKFTAPGNLASGTYLILPLTDTSGNSLEYSGGVRVTVTSSGTAPTINIAFVQDGLITGATQTAGTANFTTNGAVKLYTHWKFIFDIYQPLNHPYFRDNVMRDNTLVNVRYFDCQISVTQPDRLVEAGKFTSFNLNNSEIGYKTEIFMSNDPKVGTGLSSSGLLPTLIFDLVTPSVPLPTISDKVISTYHTIRSTARSLASNGVGPLKDMQSGNIQLAQVPDMIYVFIRSSKDENAIPSTGGGLAKLASSVPTRLGVITNLRVRTPQNSAFLINMDQESLYQMACRNGSKQSRSSFMSSLGSVIAIDPEKDLGGYTNGVLVPFTFEVVADFSLPLRSLDTETNSILRGCDLSLTPNTINFDSVADETWTMFVVCELNGHLYLMSDGTGKQTKSNLTVTEVADAVSDGIHHPSTFPGARTSKMDAGILGELGRGPGEADDGVRAALRQ